MVVESALLIALLAGVAVALRRHLARLVERLIAGGAERVVLLVRDDLRGVIDLETRRAEVIAVLEANEARFVIVGRLHHRNVDHGHPLLIVDDMQRLALEHERRTAVAPEAFEVTEVKT